jgi:hypothetical protein
LEEKISKLSSEVNKSHPDERDEKCISGIPTATSKGTNV